MTGLTTMAEERRKDYYSKIKKFGSKLKSLTTLYDPEKYPPDVLLSNKENWLNKIEDNFEEFTSVLIDMEDEDWLTEEDKRTLAAQKDMITNDMTAFILAYNTKVLQIRPVPAVPAPLSTAVSDASSTAGSEAAAQAKRTAVINVDIDYDKVRYKIKSLTKELSKCDDWNEAENHQIEAAMSKIEDWNKRMTDIEELLFTMKRNVLAHSLNDDKLSAASTAVESIRAELTDVTDNVRFEDEARCLYSMSRSKTAEVKLPTFGGQTDEDYLKFETEVKEAMRTNKVIRKDQIKKLREVLKGQAKTIIPDSIQDVDQAFSILSHMYGCPSRLVKARKNKLSSLGSFPKPGSKSTSHIKSQLEWLLALELLLTELFELADKDEDSYCEVFNATMLRSIKTYFPIKNLGDMSKFSGSVKEKLEQLYTYVTELRESSQAVLRDLDDNVATAATVSHGVTDKDESDSDTDGGYCDKEWLADDADEWKDIDMLCRMYSNHCTTLPSVVTMPGGSGPSQTLLPGGHHAAVKSSD